MKHHLLWLLERIDALDTQMQAVRRQQDQLTKRRKQLLLRKAQQAVLDSHKLKGS